MDKKAVKEEIDRLMIQLESMGIDNVELQTCLFELNKPNPNELYIQRCLVNAEMQIEGTEIINPTELFIDINPN